MSVDAVVKLGGSLLASADPRPLLLALVEAARSRRIVVVPGGGPFADAVRATTASLDPGPSAAHWMAILGMDQHAEMLAALAPEARRVASPEEIDATTGAGRLAVLAPHAWLRRLDPLPHGWHVTSDSIAAWVAGQLGAPRLVLVKPGEAPETRPRAALVDPYFETALAPSVACRIVGARDPNAVVAALA